MVAAHRFLGRANWDWLEDVDFQDFSVVLAEFRLDLLVHNDFHSDMRNENVELIDDNWDIVQFYFHNWVNELLKYHWMQIFLDKMNIEFDDFYNLFAGNKRQKKF